MNDQSESKTKPPLGIEPEYIWKQKRAFALVEAIARYSIAGMSVRNEWLAELGELLRELFPANVRAHTPGAIEGRPE